MSVPQAEAVVSRPIRLTRKFFKQNMIYYVISNYIVLIVVKANDLVKREFFSKHSIFFDLKVMANRIP